MSEFQFSPEHHERPNEVFSPSKTYIMTYDTKDLRVSDYYSFDEQVTLVKFKAIIANTLDQFAASYADGIIKLVQACEELKRNPSIGQQAIIDPQSGFNLIGRSQANLDIALRRVMEWDGTNQFMAILPYVIVAEQDMKPGDIIGGPRRLDLANCKPLVNGMMFAAQWDAENGMLRQTEPNVIAELVSRKQAAQTG